MTKELAVITENKNTEAFQKMLNAHPRKDHIKVNAQAKNSKYISISSVENLLDEYYSGCWSTENFHSQVVANEIIGSIDLKVFHPVMKDWITRTGAASVMIQVKQGMEAFVENKIKNTLVKDYPHLKAECVKNAAKSLGSVFGRNLNRETDEDYVPISQQVSTLTENQSKAYELLNTCPLPEPEKTKIREKIERSPAKVLVQIVTYLKQNQL